MLSIDKLFLTCNSPVPYLSLSLSPPMCAFHTSIRWEYCCWHKIILSWHTHKPTENAMKLLFKTYQSCIWCVDLHCLCFFSFFAALELSIIFSWFFFGRWEGEGYCYGMYTLPFNLKYTILRIPAAHLLCVITLQFFAWSSKNNNVVLGSIYQESEAFSSTAGPENRWRSK